MSATRGSRGNYWEPGWEGDCGGVRVRCMDMTKVPDLVWEIRKAIYPVNKVPSLYGVGVFTNGGWAFNDDFPDTWNSVGSATKVPDGATYSCLVPVEYLEPEVNEFGVVCP